ncbi:O-methyltransferase, family 2:Generic methyltransferase [Nitrospira sp. KM1]|uniref:methyltransferase n=1 Tax=Nitrospira sp. KM1 TaxID=1936990 RepID=UPI0013A7416D|nr:methyltransferase [Nitrospira sp. KM1]BCA56849.1 O-methyltransferase, family 2:Generic methyltransferase [Nitrospira sp. KM1]
MVLQADRRQHVMKAIRTFEEFRDALHAYRLPRVMIAALELNVFTTLDRRTWALPDLARELKVSERGLRILCRTLATAGLLVKSGNRYRNGPLGATGLNANHPSFHGAYLELLRNHWHSWSRVTESVRTGLPLDRDHSDEPDYRRQFTWAMHHRTLEIAPKIAAHLSLKGAGSLLDLGGGPGTYALAFLAKNRGLHATVCDRPAALDVAREIAATHTAGKRLSFIPLDLLSDEIPGTYDVIWYSNVLHIYSPEENRTVFRKAKAALSPGGRLIIQDAFLHDPQGIYPVDASLFAVSMLLFTETGDTYSVKDVTAWLANEGFTAIRSLRMKKENEDWEGGILEARNAAVPVRRRRRPSR